MDCPRVLLLTPDDLRRVLADLKGADLKGPQIMAVVQREPSVLALERAAFYEPLRALRRVLRAAALPQVLSRCPRLLTTPPTVWQPTMDFLLALRLPREILSALISKAPGTLQCTPDTLKLKWKFFTQELGLQTSDIVKYARELFAASLVTKAGPRTALLRQRGLNPNPPTFLRHSDTSFARKLRMSTNELRAFTKEWGRTEGPKWAAATRPSRSAQAIAQRAAVGRGMRRRAKRSPPPRPRPQGPGVEDEPPFDPDAAPPGPASHTDPP